MKSQTVTEQELIAWMEEAASREMTPAENFWQRVSFVMSGMPPGTDRNEIAMKLANNAGFDAPPKEFPNAE